MPLIEVGSSAAPGVYPENGTKQQLHTKASQQSLAKPEASFNSEPTAAAGGPLISLFNLQGQKWQQVFDLDKVIKQLRTAEKTYLRGGKNSSSNAAAAAAAAAAGGDQHHSQQQQQQQQQAKVQVQRLQSADMAYYDLVPKLASRDIVLCGSCSGSYTKAGFQHHIALQHPSVWEATSSKVVSPNGNHSIASGSGDARLTATESHNSQETGGGGGGLVPHSPTDTLLSASTLSSCSNGSSSSASLQHPAGTSSSSSSSSRHKSSSSKSSSSSSSKGSSSGGGGSSSSGGGGSRSRSKSSKNRHHSSPAPAAPAEHKESKGSKKSGGSSSSSSIAIAAPPIVVSLKEDPPAAATVPAITVFSSSSNSSCSLPPTPAAAVASSASDVAVGLGVHSFSPAEAEKLPELQPRKKLKGSSDHRTKVEKEKNKAKPMVNPYEQHQQQQQVLSELDQAVSSITAGAIVEQQQQQQVAPNDEEELPLPNTSDDNSISQTLDEMLDSKLINEILNNFDESALDTSQQQQQPSQNGNAMPHPAQATKRLRFEDGDTGEGYASYPQVYAAAAAEEEDQQQQELTTIDAMQLQQLIYQQQQMLEQQQQQEQHQQQQQDQKLLQDQEQQRQFSVYNVQSLTDEAMANPQQQQQQQLEEHMILPSIIYEISDSNPVSMLEQQKVIAEFLTQAGYENVDVNVLAQTEAPAANHNHLADELSDFDFSKLETVSDTVKTVKLEAATGPSQAPASTTNPQVNHHHHHASLDDSFFNVMLYSGSPRPLAVNTFGMVKLPQGLGVTFRKNLLTTRKANNSLLSLTGGSHLGVVGQLARPPPPPPPHTSSPAPALSNGLPTKNSSAGRTIYAQRSSVIAQDRLRCNKRALLAPVGKIGGAGGVGAMTPKRLNELLMGKQVKKETVEKEASEEADQQEEDNKQLTHSFYEKRRRLLLAGKQEQLRPSYKLHPLQSNHNASQSHSHSQQQQQQQQHLLKKQLLRTLSDGSSNMNISHTPSANSSSSSPWKGNASSSNPGGSNSSSTPTSSDLMRVFVGS
ncbi:hypothetical protein KR054_007865 [Drosophila jambulina]|nr:hypothetical protein KR054_007865 [Drosophila jambulina]